MIAAVGRARCIVLCVVLAAAAPGTMPAQTAAGRDAIFRLRDSLARTHDTTSLLALEMHTIDSARKNRDDALLHMRLGFVGMRLAELTSSPGHFRDAEGEFEWATQLQPRWPLGWYGLGTAELLEADVFPTGLRGLFAALGHDIFIAPAHDFAQSAAVDSSFTYGIVQLGDEAMRSGMPAHLTTAILALREAAVSAAGHQPDVLLQRGRVEREVGDIDSAIVAFQSLLDRNRSDALALLEMARTRLSAGRIGGTDQWYLGLSLADSATAALYHLDMKLVMSDSLLRAFDAARSQERVTIAHRFWDSRDLEAVNSSAERLKEHYRRIEYSHRNYPLLPRTHRYDSVKAFDPTGSLFDDRGRIYVRHGEPDDRSTYSMSGIPPNESWVYRRPNGTDMLFNFAQPDSAQGWRLYESLLDIVALGAAAQHTGQGNVRGMLEGGTALATFGAGWTAQAAQELLHSRTNLSPIYAKMLSGGPAAAKALQTSERAAGRNSLKVGLQTDSWKFGYELPLAANVDVVAVGSDAAGTQVQVVFAIPGGSLYAPPSNGIVIYPIRMRVSLRNPAGDVVASLDTLRQFGASAPIPETGTLLGRVPMHVPPGNYTARVALETASRGMITKPQPVHVASVKGSAIELSDLALGARTVPLPWRVDASDTAWINPMHLFRQHEPMQLFFEVGGVTAGTAYHGELAVIRAGQSTPQLQVGFNAVATGTPDKVHREIDLGRLGRGSYLLRVTVSATNGAKSVRQREFTVGN